MDSYGRRPPFCEDCGHSWWHHCGLYEPGCSHLGDCRCFLYQSPDGVSLDQLMYGAIGRRGCFWEAS